ncbi:acyl carrier protein [Micromonospora sp. WMMD882]|uniref:acyl carrier protein n=1 Tax=Micromonospora sp. WMMD882 TaxID=3015151 RepID=UPI00248B90A9|nr:acyl carrier protein [Micromonospora sp. WMMD882]WBB80356.1 acyl carrier protein [Micromonospora sp. WMMD882]
MEAMDGTAARDDVAPGSQVEKDILAFLEAQTRRSWDPQVDLFAAGGLSSLFAMQLVVHLEQTYRIAIRGADLRLNNFRTVTSMVALVRRLRGTP